jgi:NAD+ synthase (glutamine-hydrolysing)
MPPTLETRRPRVPQLAELPFYSIYRHGFVRGGRHRPWNGFPAVNVVEMVRIARESAANQAILVVFPELGISAYSNEDLFQQDALLDGSVLALGTLLEASKEISITLAVGMPLRVDDRLFNCAVLLRHGELLGAVPKSYLPSYREFYEKRQFAPAAQALATSIQLLGQTVPFGTRLLFEAKNVPGFEQRLEFCEDVWAP